MSDLIIKKNGTDYNLPMLAEHYPADRVYLDGDTSKTVQDAIDELNDNLVIEFETNTIPAGTITPDVVNTYLAPLPTKAGYTPVFTWFVGMNGTIDWVTHITNIIPHSNGRNLAFVPDGSVGDVIVTFAIMYKKVQS